MPHPQSAKKCTGRRAILGLVLTARGDVQCNMLAERGANKSDGWGLGSSAAELSSRDEECAADGWGLGSSTAEWSM